MLGLGVRRGLLYIWQLKINFQITSISWAPLNAFVGAVIGSTDPKEKNETPLKIIYVLVLYMKIHGFKKYNKIHPTLC